MEKSSSLMTRKALRQRIHELESAASATQSRTKQNVGWPHWALLVTSIVALVVAAISGGITLQSTYFAANEQRDKESREARAKVYADFLEAVDRREAAAIQLQDFRWAWLATWADPCMPSAKRPKALPKPPSTTSYDSADVQYKRQRNLIKVYGTDAGWDAAERIDKFQPAPETAEALDVRWSSFPNHSYACEWDSQKPGIVTSYRFNAGMEGGGEGYASLAKERERYDLESFRAAYEGFQAVFCREAPAKPRMGCG